MGAVNTELKATSLDDLEKFSSGQLVELPAFAEGCPFIARLKRPSMLSLMMNKKIPNQLIVSAQELFEKGTESFNADDENAMENLFNIMEVICEASFVEPTYSAIKSHNVELTDEQMMFVFQYSQAGVKAITPIHQE